MKVNGEGSIVQLEKGKAKGKCRKWQLRVCTGKNPRTGKYQAKTRRVECTYTEATKLLREFIAEIEGDKVTGRSGTTFEEECKRLIEERKASGNYSDNRLRRLETTLKAACMHIGQADFTRVTPEMLNNMYAAMRGGDTLSGKPVGGTYIRSVHSEVSLVYKQAIKEGRASYNPCDYATPPNNDTQPRRAMPADQMKAFREQLDLSDEHDFAWWLAVTLGLRRGEVCGLSWGDLDASARTLMVCHSYDRAHNLKATKTAAGRRKLPLTAQLVEAFAEHRQAQRERGVPISPASPIVVTEANTRVAPDMLEKWWRSDRAGLGAEGYCLHELRHSYLTSLARAGVHPKVMQELAGHANSAITMEIYTHTDMNEKFAAAEAWERAMG